MKRFTSLVLATLLLTSILAGCGKSDDNKTPAADNTNTAKKEDVSIRVFQFKVEIADAMNRMAEEYEKETGVHVDIETHGGGEDYGALLKADFAAGSEPEIFANGGFTGLEPYMSRATDLSSEPWVADVLDTAKEPVTVDGKLYGMPMNTEGYGLIYNKDLFAKAGITETPTTLTQLTDAVKKLQAAGITPFEATNEWWSLGIHLVNVAIASQPDPAKFAEDLKAGKTTIKENQQFKEWLNLVDLIFNNGQKNKLTTDYSTQVAEFASGKAAMMQQGNWTQPDIDKVNPELNLGVLPLPINDSEGRVLVGVPSNWIVNSKSAHPEEAKAFLNWMVSSETGKKFLTKEFKFMPALKSITATEDEIGQVAVAIQGQASTALGWQWDRFPDGTMQGFGAAMQEYMGAQITKDQLLEKLDKAVEDIMKK